MSKFFASIRTAVKGVAPIFSLTRLARFAAELKVFKKVRTIGFFGGSSLIMLGADLGEKLKDTSLATIVAVSAIATVLLYAYASRQLRTDAGDEAEGHSDLPTYFFLISAGALVGSALLWILQETVNTPKDESTILAALSRTVATEFEEVDEGISDIKEQLSEINLSRKSEEYGAQLSFEVDEITGDPMIVRGTMNLGELADLNPTECEFVGSLAETRHYKLEAKDCDRFEAKYTTLSSNPLEYTKEMNRLISVFGVSAPLLRVELPSGDELRLPAYSLITVLTFPHGGMPREDVQRQVTQSMTYTLIADSAGGAIVARAQLGGKPVPDETECEWSGGRSSAAIEFHPTGTHCVMELRSRSNIFDQADREIKVVFKDRNSDRFLGMASTELADAVIDLLPSAFTESLTKRDPVYRVTSVSPPNVKLESVEIEVKTSITDSSVPRLTLEQFNIIADPNRIERLLNGDVMNLGGSRATVISQGSTVSNIAYAVETPAKIAICSLIAVDREKTLAIEVWGLGNDGQFARLVDSHTAAPQGMSNHDASRLCAAGGYWPKSVLNSLRSGGDVPDDMTIAGKKYAVTDACSAASTSAEILATCIREVEQSVRSIDLEVDAKPCWSMNKRYITALYHMRDHAQFPDNLELPSCKLLAEAGAILNAENDGSHVQQYQEMVRTTQTCVSTHTPDTERFRACMQFVENGAPLIALEGACKRRNSRGLTKENLDRWVATAKTRYTQALGQYASYLPSGISDMPADAAMAFQFIEGSADLYSCSTVGL